MSYVDCEKNNTPYRVLAALTNELNDERRIPISGIHLDKVKKCFYDAVREKNILCVLDNRERLGKKYVGELMSCLSSVVNLISVWNVRTIDDGVSEAVYFRDYGRKEIKHIVERRIKSAVGHGYEEKVRPEVIEYIFQRAGKNLRYAIELARLTFQCAEKETIDLECLRKVERRLLKEGTDRLPTPQHTILFESIVSAKTPLTTGKVYELYRNLASVKGAKVLSDRQINNLILELSEMDLINIEVISKGRYGRTTEITTSNLYRDIKC